jgi:hypothetical protein
MDVIRFVEDSNLLLFQTLEVVDEPYLLSSTHNT